MTIVIIHLLFRIIDIPFLCYHSSHPYPMSCIPYSLLSYTTTIPLLHRGFQTQNKYSKKRVLDEKNWAKFHRWLSWIIISLSCHYCDYCLVREWVLSTYPMPFILVGLPPSTSLSIKDSFWSSIMSNNLPQSAAWLFPDTLDIPMPFILVGLPPSTSLSNIHSRSFLTGIPVWIVHFNW